MWVWNGCHCFYDLYVPRARIEAYNQEDIMAKLPVARILLSPIADRNNDHTGKQHPTEPLPP